MSYNAKLYNFPSNVISFFHQMYSAYINNPQNHKHSTALVNKKTYDQMLFYELYKLISIFWKWKPITSN